MSIAELALGDLLQTEFNHKAIPQYLIRVGGTVLFLDYYIPHLRLAFETDGRQHDKYVQFFHHTRIGFDRSQIRDRLKEQWCSDNRVLLIRFKYNEKVDQNTLREKINSAIH